MTDTLIDCEIFICMNEDGEWAVAKDTEQDASDALDEDATSYQKRTVKVTIKMSPPKMANLAITVPTDAGQQEALAHV